MIEVEKSSNKSEQYRILLKQTRAMFEGEPNQLANMANLCSLVHHSFDHHWTGFYFIDGDELVLGPFQGPPACTRIAKGKGVCGTVWATGQTEIVGNVHEFPGHIACSAKSNSEIALPVRNGSGEIIGVFDIDSVYFDHFNEEDQLGLEQILNELEK